MRGAFLGVLILSSWLLGAGRVYGQPGATIALQLQEGRPFVRAEINQVPLSLLVDLGGYDTVALNQADAGKAGAQPQLSPNETLGGFSTFDGKRQQSSVSRFREVLVGGVPFGEVRGSIFGGEGTSYVGAGLLGKSLLVFDYAKQQLRLYQSGDAQALRRECGANTFPVDVRRGVFLTYLRVEGKTLVAAFDTGASFTVMRPSVWQLDPVDYVPGTTPQIRRLHGLRINDAEIKELNAALIEFKGPPVDIVLGTNFFTNRRVCLDSGAHVGAISR